MSGKVTDTTHIITMVRDLVLCKQSLLVSMSAVIGSGSTCRYSHSYTYGQHPHAKKMQQYILIPSGIGMGVAYIPEDVASHLRLYVAGEAQRQGFQN